MDTSTVASFWGQQTSYLKYVAISPSSALATNTFISVSAKRYLSLYLVDLLRRTNADLPEPFKGLCGNTIRGGVYKHIQ